MTEQNEQNKPAEQIAYEPHPVSPERKAELRKAGYKIIDAVFAPKGEADAGDESTDDQKPRRGRRRSAD